MFKSIQMVLDHLKPDNMNIMVFHKKPLPNGLSYEKIEPWFKTPYVDIGVYQLSPFFVLLNLFNTSFLYRNTIRLD